MTTRAVYWLCKERSRRAYLPDTGGLKQCLSQIRGGRIHIPARGPRKVLGRCESYEGEGGIYPTCSSDERPFERL
jgi:hypothetical protein